MKCWILTSKNLAKLKQYFHAEFLQEVWYVHVNNKFLYVACNVTCTHACMWFSQRVKKRMARPVDAPNSAIFLHLAYTQFKGVLPSGLSYSTYFDAYLQELEKFSLELNVSLQSNPYANVLYDSIWAVALTINRSLSELNERNFSLTNIHRVIWIQGLILGMCLRNNFLYSRFKVPPAC